jgi:hypothetical protein
MERARRCGFLIPQEPDARTPVWIRKDLVLFECPKSYVSAKSLGYLESYAVWKRHGGSYASERDARETDAFVVLAKELEEEELRDASEIQRANEQRRFPR